MALPRLTRLELQVMDALWTHGASSVREIQEAFPEKDRPAYTTIQTMVYRLEAKKAVRRLKKIGNAHIFEAAISRNAAQRRLIDLVPTTPLYEDLNLIAYRRTVRGVIYDTSHNQPFLTTAWLDGEGT